MRLKAEIWVKAYIRGCAVAGVPAVVVRHGDDDAGAIYIRINRLDGTSLIYGPAPAGFDGAETDRSFVLQSPRAGEADAIVDERLRRELEFDRDLWLVEVEDRSGRHFLDGWLQAS